MYTFWEALRDSRSWCPGFVEGLLPNKPGEKESVLSDQDDKEIMTKVAYFVKSDNSTLKYEAEFY